MSSQEPPKIYTKNYINADDVFTFSHGGTSGYLHDSDPLSKLLSSGANADTTTMSVVIQFYEGSVATTRTIDTFFLLNHNYKTWALYYWDTDTSAWVSAASETVDAAANTVKSFTAFTTSQIKIEVSATQVANAEKYAGEMIACALTLNVGYDMAAYTPKFREKKKELQLGDGSVHQVLTRFTPYRTQKYDANVQLKFVAYATKELLRAIKEAGMPFLWQPEPTSRPEDVRYVHWWNAFDAKFVSSYKTAGFVINMELREV